MPFPHPRVDQMDTQFLENHSLIRLRPQSNCDQTILSRHHTLAPNPPGLELLTWQKIEHLGEPEQLAPVGVRTQNYTPSLRLTSRQKTPFLLHSNLTHFCAEVILMQWEISVTLSQPQPPCALGRESDSLCLCSYTYVKAHRQETAGRGTENGDTEKVRMVS